MPRYIALLLALLSVSVLAWAAVVPPPVTGRFPLSFRNPKGMITSPIPKFSWCNDKRQLDGTKSCGDFTSQMRWGNAGFAPANCNPTPGASGFNLKPVGDNADGAAILIPKANPTPEIIGHFQHINFLIHENPGMFVNIHLSILIEGLQDLTAQWNVRHDETTNWFLGSGCPRATYPDCCGAACQSTTCSNCMNKYPKFCPYGGSPCIVGCNDGVGFTTDFPLRWDYPNVKKVGNNPNILPNCRYDVSVWWDVDPTIKSLRGGVPVNGVFVTKEGQDNTAPLKIEITTTCQETCPPCSPCEQCVNFKCVPKCNDPCAPCVNGVCTAVTCKDKCSQCVGGTCVPTTVASTCDACSKCDGTSGKCAADSSICDTDKCFQCNPADGGKCSTPRQPLCNACQICDPASGGCVDAGHCNLCQQCVADNSTDGFTCQDRTDICNPCTTCDPSTGSCLAVTCPNSCSVCNTTTNACEVTVEAPCGANTECNWCDESGACVARVNAECTLEDNDACRNPYCDATGTCVLSSDPAAVGTVCSPATECMTHICGENGTCVDVPAAANAICTIPGIDAQCQKAVCDGAGLCVPQDLTTGAPCATLPEDATDRNKTLCRAYVCEAGRCVTQPHIDGTNCTHRINESDPEERICVFSICSDGVCVSNKTLPACLPKHKGKTGFIVGVAVGVAALVLAGAAAAWFFRGSSTPPLAAGQGADYMNASLLDNPIYNNSPSSAQNPLYNEDL